MKGTMRTARFSPVGKALWLHMQGHEPCISMSNLQWMLEENGSFPTTRTSISNYLHGRYTMPPEFVNAVVDTLDLSEEEEVALHWLYFRGSPTTRKGE